VCVIKFVKSLANRNLFLTGTNDVNNDSFWHFLRHREMNKLPSNQKCVVAVVGNVVVAVVANDYFLTPFHLGNYMEDAQTEIIVCCCCC